MRDNANQPLQLAFRNGELRRSIFHTFLCGQEIFVQLIQLICGALQQCLRGQKLSDYPILPIAPKAAASSRRGFLILDL